MQIEQDHKILKEIYDQFTDIVKNDKIKLTKQIEDHDSILCELFNVENSDLTQKEQLAIKLIQLKRVKEYCQSLIDASAFHNFKIGSKIYNELTKSSQEKVQIFLNKFMKYFVKFQINYDTIQTTIKYLNDNGCLFDTSNLDLGISEEIPSKKELAVFLKDFEHDIDQWENTSNSSLGMDVIVMNDEEMKQFDDEDSDEEDELELEANFNEDESQRKFEAHTDFVYCLGLNPIHKDIFASGGGDDMAFIWSFEQEKPLHILKGHSDTIQQTKFNYLGNLLATGCMDSTIKIWDIENGQLKTTLEGPSEEIRFLDWHQKGNVICAGSSDCSVWMWAINKDQGQFLGSFYGHEKAITDGGFTPDGKFIASASEDCSIRIWNPKTTELVHKIHGHGFHNSQINCISFSQTQPLILSGDNETLACLSNYQSGKVLGQVTHTEGVESVAFSKQGDFFVTGSQDCYVRLFDTAKLSTKGSCLLDSAVTKLQIIDEQHLMVCSTSNGSIYTFDYRQKDKINRMTSPSCIHNFVVDTQKFQILCASEDGLIRQFQLQSI